MEMLICKIKNEDSKGYLYLGKLCSIYLRPECEVCIATA